MAASYSLRACCCYLLAILLVSLRAEAQPCADYADQLNWMGGITTEAPPHAVTVSGHLAFLASGSGRSGSLDIVDIKDPRQPGLLSRIDVGGYARRVAVDGTYAFLAVESIGLVVVDVSLPSKPVLIGTAPMRLGGYGLAVTESSAYVANYDGLRVVDVSNPTAPTVRGAVETPGYAVGVAASGNHFVYVADGYAGLRAVDISDPAVPRLAGGADTPGFAYGIAIADDVAYVADWTGGVSVVSIADPAQPVVVNTVDVPGEAWSVALSLSKDRAYVTGKGSGFIVLDISDPVVPKIVGTFAAGGEDVAAEGTLACIVDGRESLHLLDVTSIKSVTIIGHAPTVRRAWDVVLDEDLAYVANDLHGGLQIFDLTDPTKPTVIGSVPSGDAMHLAMAKPFVYVGDRLFGFRIVDVTKPTHPVVAGSIPIPNIVRGIAVRDGLAYLGTHGLEIVDVADPEAPTIIASLAMEDYAAGVAAHITGDSEHVYVTDVDGAFSVIDVSPPESLHVVAKLALPSYYLEGIALNGKYAYVTGHGIYSGIDFMVIDISDPLAPGLRGTLNLRGSGRDVTVSDGVAYVASHYGSSLEVVDVRDPWSPRLIGGRTTAGSAGVAVDERHVVIAGGGGLSILYRQCAFRPEVDIAALNPDLATWSSNSLVPGIPHPLQSGQKAAASPVAHPILRIAGPHPLTPAAFPVEIRFTLSGSSAFRLGIYNSTGRLIRSLAGTEVSSGEHAAFWDGDSRRGGRVASGTYFCRLSSPQGDATARLVVLR